MEGLSYQENRGGALSLQHRCACFFFTPSPKAFPSSSCHLPVEQIPQLKWITSFLLVSFWSIGFLPDTQGKGFLACHEPTTQWHWASDLWGKSHSAVISISLPLFIYMVEVQDSTKACPEFATIWQNDLGVCVGLHSIYVLRTYTKP